MASLIHFVGYTLAAGVTDEKIARVRDGFAALTDAVDGAELMCIGPNVSRSAFARDWQYAAVVRLRDPAVLAAYIAHPVHDALGIETRDGFYDRCAVLDIATPDGPDPDFAR